MLIKICGLTDPETAYQTALAGADYIGLIFSEVSPRKVTYDVASNIADAARRGGAQVVIVLVDESLAQIEEIVAATRATILQLHGDSVRALCDILASKYQIIYVSDGKTLPDSLNPAKDFILYDDKNQQYANIENQFRTCLAGNLNIDNINIVLDKYKTNGVDLSSAVEFAPGVKDIKKIREFIMQVRPGRYGKFGGRYVPELLMSPLKELDDAFKRIALTDEFALEYTDILKNHIGRPTALTEVKNFAKELGDFQVFLKREDLLHTGAHKINNAVGQCLLAKKMGKTKIVAETGAGQHGLAVATASAMFGLTCIVYMGRVDIERQAPNVTKMRLLGATVVAVDSGSATLKDAVNEALRHWGAHYDETHYCLGSALGPDPFPKMVAHFHAIIGREAREQFLERNNGLLPDKVIACVGGGSNAIGIFQGFLENKEVELIGVEAGGTGSGLGHNAARFSEGSPGVLHGSYTYLLQDSNRQIVDTYSISAGLDYPAIGPQHSDLYETGRAKYDCATDQEALNAFLLLTKTEGIIPALESSHALGYLMRIAPNIKSGSRILINLSGRGDKDLPQLLKGALKHVASN